MDKFLVRYKRTITSPFVFTQIIGAEGFNQAFSIVKSLVSDDEGEILMIQKIDE